MALLSMAESGGLSWEAQEVFQKIKSFGRLPGSGVPMIQLNMRVGSARTVKKGIPVICDNQVARIEQRPEFQVRQVSHPATGVNDDEFGRPSVGLVGDNHGCAVTLWGWLGNAASIALMISAAESAGRFSVLGSASGTASAWSGVSMSPGSIERKETPSPAVPSAGCGYWWNIQAHNTKRSPTRSRSFPTGNELPRRVTFVIPRNVARCTVRATPNGNPHVGSKIPRVRGRASGLGEDSQVRQGAPDV